MEMTHMTFLRFGLLGTGFFQVGGGGLEFGLLIEGFKIILGKNSSYTAKKTNAMVGGLNNASEQLHFL